MMEPQQISSMPDWYEPYNISLGIRVGGLLFLSGQAAVDELGNTVGGDDFEAQARQAFANLSKVLSAAGAGLSDVVKVTFMVTDMAANLDSVIRLRGEYFSRPFPADTLLEVSSLARPDWLVEIDAIAIDRRNAG
ncbi:MAG: RidA family protein [Microbacteriaceae bacterium]|nr:MAG: RidA family protein [Microbacteriaceae bacterium]